MLETPSPDLPTYNVQPPVPTPLILLGVSWEMPPNLSLGL